MAVRPYADLIQQRRQAAGLPYADQNLKYQEAGHLIGPPYHPTNLSQLSDLALGGTPKAYALADADSWPRVLSCLGAQ